MSVEPIGIVALLFGIASFFLPLTFIVYVFLCSTLLGASAALTLDSLGGTSVQPAHLLLGFLAYKSMTERGAGQRILQSVSFGRPGFWLLLTTIYAVLSAYIMPRLFAGQTMTFPVRSEGYKMALAPATSNLTQSVYFVGDFVCFILIAGYAGKPSGKRVLGDAALVCARLNLMFAVLDLLTYFTGTADLFAFIRNANYAMLNDTEVAGFKRIVGSFTEASSFGAVTLGYFAFTGRLWLLGIRTRLNSILTVCSLSALLFSTSTTAYVGLGGFLALAYLEALFRLFNGLATRQMMWFIFGAPIILGTLLMAVALNDTSALYLQNLADTFVLNKMSTDSGIERSSWNRSAMQNFFDTFGFGVGTGSLRASSFPVAVLSNFGILGTACFVAFFLKVFLPSRHGADEPDNEYRSAAKAACIAWLVTATTSGALVDLGLPFFALAALACSAPVRAPIQSKVNLLKPHPGDQFI
jgi:hypothetical protein